MTIRIHMQVQNGDLHLGYFKINAVSNSGVVILGDAETIRAESVSTSKGVVGPLIAPVVAPALGALGSVS